MGFWDRFKAAFSRKDRNTGLEISKWVAAPYRRGTPELLKAYREQPLLRNIVEKISDNVADVTFRAYRRVDKNGRAVKDFSLRSAPAAVRWARIKALRDSGELEELPDFPLLKLLSDPNEHLTGRSTLKLAQIHMDLVGETFFRMARAGKMPISLWPVPPSAITRLPEFAKPKSEWFYSVSFGGRNEAVPADEILHFRSSDPEDPLGRGVGTAFTLGDELDTDEYAARFTKNYFWNSAMPAGLVSVEGTQMSKEQQTQFRESLSREHQGPEKAGKIAVTNGKVTFARLDTTFKDMELVRLREHLSDFVRMTYGIPPEVIGNLENSNKATAFAAEQILARQVTIPRLEFWRTEFQKRLAPLFPGGDNVILDYDSPVPEDREHTLRVMMARPDGFTWDEWRAQADKRPHPEKQGFPAPAPGTKEQLPDGTDPDPQSAEGAKEEAEKPA